MITGDVGMDESGVNPFAITRSFGSFEQSIADANVTNLVFQGLSLPDCAACAVTMYSSGRFQDTSWYYREVRE
jgi:hypothetical protein